MKLILSTSHRLLLQILLLLCCYFASRVIFTLINTAHFPWLGVGGFFKLAVYAVRFDLSAIALTNAIYILLFLLPLPIWRMPMWERFTQWFFVIANSFVFLFELSDWAYYPYNHKRSTADVLDMVSRKGDFLSLLPDFVVDYWYVPMAWIVLIWGIYKINKIIVKKTLLPEPEMKQGLKSIGIRAGYLALVLALVFIAVRGGTQMKPLSLTDAQKYAQNEYVPVVLNTPFSVFSSLNNKRLPDTRYMSDEMMLSYVNPVKTYTDETEKNLNVVLIILESFSKEFTKMGRGYSYTPFLDSLMDVSLNCTNAYANATRSAEGIPAIIAGLPSMMEEPITTSMYGNNKLTTIPNLLKQKGYTSAFYHGGTNGTMSFDVFCRNAGFDKYYGRTEYNNEADYDGNWGIWDEPYLQYCAKNIGKLKLPFLATVFTLSSHPPYKLPAKYERELPKGKIPIETMVRYSDMSLRKFFETASKQSWYSNTLFVLLADHTSMIREKADHYSMNLGVYAIPVLFYTPGDTNLKGQYDKPVQQIDILPSIMDYVGYNKPFFAFGSSIFSEEDKFVVTNFSNSYQYYDGEYLLTVSGKESRELYRYPADSTYSSNILKGNKRPAEERMNQLRAFIQLFNSSMNKNSMWVENSN